MVPVPPQWRVIYDAWKSGDSMSTIASRLGISKQRVSVIIQKYERRVYGGAGNAEWGKMRRRHGLLVKKRQREKAQSHITAKI